MAAIGIGRVEKAQPLVVTVEQKRGQSRYPERRLVGVLRVAYGSRAHGQPTGLNACLAQRDGIRGGVLAGKRRVEERIQQGSAFQPDCPHPSGRTHHELSALHAASSRPAISVGGSLDEHCKHLAPEQGDEFCALVAILIFCVSMRPLAPCGPLPCWRLSRRSTTSGHSRCRALTFLPGMNWTPPMSLTRR